MEVAELVQFVRKRGFAVLATCSKDGSPQAALIGVAATDEGEVVFDTSARSRKYANIKIDPRVALVIGFDDEVTLQCEGVASVPVGADYQRCIDAYFRQYPDGRERATDPDITHLRVRLHWLRYSDYRSSSFTVEEHELG